MRRRQQPGEDDEAYADAVAPAAVAATAEEDSGEGGQQDGDSGISAPVAVVGGMGPPAEDDDEAEEEEEPRLVDDQFGDDKGLGRVAVAALALGVTIGVHVVLLMLSCSSAGTLWLLRWCIYILSVCLYHVAEFVVTAKYQPHHVSFSSFLLQQSVEYMVLVVVGWTEFWVELWLWPGLKTASWLWLAAALLLIVVGHVFRIGAMWTAKHHFTHQIRDDRHEGHELVTTGLYSIVRHPSYFGWFYWAIGTQLMLCNPVCTVVYALAAWRFFSMRVPFEEYHLLLFFGRRYAQYREKTPIGIPFVYGYKPQSARS